MIHQQQFANLNKYIQGKKEEWLERMMWTQQCLSKAGKVYYKGWHYQSNVSLRLGKFAKKDDTIQAMSL